MPRVALLSTSDTDLLSARSSHADYALANPSRLDVATELPAVLDGADLVIVRILGTARSWQDGLDAVRALGVPMIVLGGEQTPDAELMRLSTVPIGVAAQAHQYLAEGGPGNLGQLHAFCCDTVLLTGVGLRSADPAAGLGTAGPTDPPRTSRQPADRHPVLPGAPGVRQHRLRALAGRRRRGCRRPSRGPPRCRSSARRCAAPPTICWPSSAPWTR